MYKISDFSKIANLTVKALRYYDEENILKPSHRDNENSYRYYDESDFKKAQLILMLKELDFSIAEIKDVLANCSRPEDLSYYLKEKKEMIEARISNEKELIKRIDLYIKHNDMEDEIMDYKIEVREIAPVTVASIRFRGKYSDVGQYFGKIFRAVKGNAAGTSFSLYHDAEFNENADIEVCVPIAGTINDSSITVKKLPGVKAICTTHKGSYDSLNLAYKAIMDYSNEHNLKCLTPSREIYVKGPGMIFKGNVNNYITEILVPFEKE